MAKATYKCARCSKSESVTGFSRRDADGKAAHAESVGRLCSACYSADMQAKRTIEHAKASEEAAAANSAADLPALTGTVKQIAWAETIRATALNSPGNRPPSPPPVTASDAQAAQHGLTVEDLSLRWDRLYGRTVEARHRLETETSAKWWIDKRDVINDYVLTAHVSAKMDLWADKIAEARAAKAESERLAAAERKAASDAARLARETEHANQIAKAASFLGSPRPWSVSVAWDAITVQASDGRVASGWIIDGEWAISVIGSETISSTLPESEQIAAEAKSIWSANGRA